MFNQVRNLSALQYVHPPFIIFSRLYIMVVQNHNPILCQMLSFNLKQLYSTGSLNWIIDSIEPGFQTHVVTVHCSTS